MPRKGPAVTSTVGPQGRSQSSFPGAVMLANARRPSMGSPVHDTERPAEGEARPLSPRPHEDRINDRVLCGYRRRASFCKDEPAPPLAVVAGLHGAVTQGRQMNNGVVHWRTAGSQRSAAKHWQLGTNTRRHALGRLKIRLQLQARARPSQRPLEIHPGSCNPLRFLQLAARWAQLRNVGAIDTSIRAASFGS